MTQKQCKADNCNRQVNSRGLCKKHYVRWQRGKNINEPTAYDLTLEQRFWQKVRKTDGCWNWTGRRQHNTWYGQLDVDGSPYGTHRLSWEIHNGPIPEGMSVLHECDNPACVNPNHLFLGTQMDNMIDMWSKNRGGTYDKKGENHPMAKLHDGDVMVIRDLVDLGMKQSDVADFLDVSKSLVYQIVHRICWIHI